MAKSSLLERLFTLEHFVEWAGSLVLDTGEFWSPEPFQRSFLEDVFARSEDGTPRFDECWLVVPEGNGKTTMLAGLALYELRFRLSGSVPWAASSRDQAELGYRQAEGFVFRSGMRDEFKCLEGYRRIRCDDSGSRLQVFAADDRTGDGIIPTLPILDELHRHKSLALYRTWAGKLAKRDGQLIAISTAGEPGSEFEETRERIRQEAEQVDRDDCFLRAVSGGVVLHEWAVPEGGDVEDLELVERANPFSGVTVETLRAKRGRPTMTISHWRRFTCNLPTRSVDSAVSEREWAVAEVDPSEWPAGVPVVAGLDVAWTRDTTALVPVWVRDEHYRLLGAATILEPPGDGTMLDPRAIERAIVELHKRNPIATLVMDTTDAMETAAWVEDTLGIPVVDRQQTNPLAVLDYDRFMEALREGWLHHIGDQGLSRHVLNSVAVDLPLGDSRFGRPSRSRASAEMQPRRVIDALIAAAMAHNVAVADFYEPPSTYRAVGF